MLDYTVFLETSVSFALIDVERLSGCALIMITCGKSCLRASLRLQRTDNFRSPPPLEPRCRLRIHVPRYPQPNPDPATVTVRTSGREVQDPKTSFHV